MNVVKQSLALNPAQRRPTRKSYQIVYFSSGHDLQDFDEVMDCDMREGKFDWFKNGKLNAAGNAIIALLFKLYLATSQN